MGGVTDPTPSCSPLKAARQVGREEAGREEEGREREGREEVGREQVDEGRGREGEGGEGAGREGAGGAGGYTQALKEFLTGSHEGHEPRGRTED